MTTPVHNPAVASNKPRRDAAIDFSRIACERILKAMRVLETALAKAAPNRESAWRKVVLTALMTLEDAMKQRTVDLTGEEGLLTDIVRDQPRLAHRIVQIRRQYEDLLRQIGSLRDEYSAEDYGSLPDVADIRRRLAWLLDALRHCQSRETDLIFEAIQVDIGEVD